jgi:transcriptional regulator with XRE-family HTH domain
MNRTDFLTQNLVVLLARDRESSTKGRAEVLAQWAGVSVERARGLLNGARPTDKEIRRIAETVGHSAEELYHSDLLQGADIRLLNLQKLLGSLEHGGQRGLAAALDVNEATISKWKSGSQTPSPKHLQGISEHFHLGRDVDLARDPLFLDEVPIGTYERRRWLAEQVNSLPADELNKLFPALEKLVRRG